MASATLRKIASTLLKLDDTKAMVCVPSSSEATQLVDLVERTGGINLRKENFEKILILTQHVNLYNTAKQLSINSLSNVYSKVYLFWRQYLNEGIKSLESYKELYEYHLKKCESLLFVEFFKKNVCSAFKDVESSFFVFIHRLPSGTFSGIHADNIAHLKEHMKAVTACLTKNFDNDALCYVLGICPPPTKISAYYHQGVDAAMDLKEKMNICLQTLKVIKSSLKLKEFETRDEIKEYLLSKSKIIICTPSSFSEMGSILSKLNHSDAHAMDLVLIDDALMTRLSDIEIILDFPAVKNTVLFSEITSPDMDFKELPPIRKRHQFATQYELCKDEKKCLMDNELEPSIAPFGWVGIPQNMLPPVRNQGSTDTCTFQSTLAAAETHYKLEASVDTPPRKFTIELCVEDMDKLYKTRTGKELGSEISNKEKGRSRVEHALAILKQEGVIGKSRSTAEKVPVAFRISSFEKYSIHDFAKICKLLEECKVMVGFFRLSRNYFNLKPRKPYIYDDKQPIINSKSKLPCSHAILLVGFLPNKLSDKKKLAEGGCKVEPMSKNLVYQNSYGKLFGEDGFGVVAPSSVQKFYLPIL